MLFVATQAQSVNATEISYTFTGDYTSLEGGTDSAGLVGSSFLYTSVFERTPLPGDCTVDPSFTSCVYFVGTASLTLTGTAGGVRDGTFSIGSFTAQSIRQEPSLTYFSGNAFNIGGFELDVMNLVPINPALFTGVGSLLPILTTADILSGPAFGGTDGFANVYGITNITVSSSVPEPSAAAILLIGLLGLRRKIRG